MDNFIDRRAEQLKSHNKNDTGNYKRSNVLHTAVTERMLTVRAAITHFRTQNRNNRRTHVGEVVKRIRQNRNTVHQTSDDYFNREKDDIADNPKYAGQHTVPLSNFFVFRIIICRYKLFYDHFYHNICSNLYILQLCNAK